jgi:hypothetical protein
LKEYAIEAAIEEKTMNWWGSRSNVSPRLRLEVEAMRATFGDTFKLIVPQFGPLYWEGLVEVNLATLRSPDHTLKILYPNEYPNRPAEAYCIRPRIFSEKHQYEDGQLCLFNPKDGTQYALHRRDGGGVGGSMAVCLLHMARHR